MKIINLDMQLRSGHYIIMINVPFDLVIESLDHHCDNDIITHREYGDIISILLEFMEEIELEESINFLEQKAKNLEKKLKRRKK